MPRCDIHPTRNHEQKFKAPPKGLPFIKNGERSQKQGTIQYFTKRVTKNPIQAFHYVTNWNFRENLIKF